MFRYSGGRGDDRKLNGSSLSSEAVAAIYGGIAGGIVGGTLAIAATVVGQWLAQWFRRRGKVRCFVPHTTRPQPHTSPREPLNYAITFSFPLWFFNEKETAIGIAELVLTFSKGGEQLAMAYIKEKGSNTPLRTLDLPPRKWVFKEIEFETGIAQETLATQRDEDPATFEELRLNWSYPTGKEESQVIPTTGHDEPWTQRIKCHWVERRV